MTPRILSDDHEQKFYILCKCSKAMSSQWSPLGVWLKRWKDLRAYLLKRYILMDGCMDGWMDGCMDGWMDFITNILLTKGYHKSNCSPFCVTSLHCYCIHVFPFRCGGRNTPFKLAYVHISCMGDVITSRDIYASWISILNMCYVSLALCNVLMSYLVVPW